MRWLLSSGLGPFSVGVLTLRAEKVFQNRLKERDTSGSSFFCSGKKGRKEKRDSFLLSWFTLLCFGESLRQEKWGLSLLRVGRDDLVQGGRQAQTNEPRIAG